MKSNNKWVLVDWKTNDEELEDIPNGKVGLDELTKNINNKPQKVTFWANREQSKYVLTKPLHKSQQQIGNRNKDGSCIFQIEVVLNFELYSVLMSYGPGLRVLSPQKVVKGSVPFFRFRKKGTVPFFRFGFWEELR